MIYSVTVPDRLTPFWALALGFTLGILALIVFVGGQGNTPLEVLIPSIILLVALLIIQPVFYRAAANAAKHRTQQKTPATFVAGVFAASNFTFWASAYASTER